MKVLVVIGHQNKGSFCHAIAAAAVEELRGPGHEVVFHDLYEEHFDPILPHAEIPKDARGSTRSCGGTATRWLAADGYVVVHPNWWGQPPAILKGWLDRVFRQGVVYEFTPRGSTASSRASGRGDHHLEHAPRPGDRLFGDPLENLWKAVVFNFCGVEDFYRRNFESIILSTPDQRERGWTRPARPSASGFRRQVKPGGRVLAAKSIRMYNRQRCSLVDFMQGPRCLWKLGKLARWISGNMCQKSCACWRTRRLRFRP